MCCAQKNCHPQPLMQGDDSLLGDTSLQYLQRGLISSYFC
ncbi:hypothetical protein PORCRE_81 [Porphyromonas crevioricanis JCM 15906]|uniref:Uncharacterized protein n=1 Tax=Porphyromonas crevioricanis JCM 15906 TaxID=1305617 RepID=S4NFP8_9PORP|nr:hypothetical protein PORCRE_81 [Porphyromonas crevioricanis JCM 15906]GAD07304.1 hypothetical protein PORCAN_924 [Porphyromonas crevioricanis JCM 13913]